MNDLENENISDREVNQKARDEIKRPQGRPTKYKEEYNERIIELGKQGCHVEEMASAIGIHVDTLYEWGRNYPLFSESFTYAKQCSLSWWLAKGRSDLNEKFFNDRCWEFNLRAKWGLGDKDRKHKNDELFSAKTFEEQKNAILKSFAGGKLTTKEWLEMVNGLAALAKIEETHELKAMIEEIKEKIG